MYDDLEGIEVLHNDAIMINVTIYNCLVKRVLFDNAREGDILYYAVAKIMGLRMIN